jgi:hypothetical protein
MRTPAPVRAQGPIRTAGTPERDHHARACAHFGADRNRDERTEAFQGEERDPPTRCPHGTSDDRGDPERDKPPGRRDGEDAERCIECEHGKRRERGGAEGAASGASPGPFVEY